jgi:hypothetical protein
MADSPHQAVTTSSTTTGVHPQGVPPAGQSLPTAVSPHGSLVRAARITASPGDRARPARPGHRPPAPGRSLSALIRARRSKPSSQAATKTATARPPPRRPFPRRSPSRGPLPRRPALRNHSHADYIPRRSPLRDHSCEDCSRECPCCATTPARTAPARTAPRGLLPRVPLLRDHSCEDCSREDCSRECPCCATTSARTAPASAPAARPLPRGLLRTAPARATVARTTGEVPFRQRVQCTAES